jgi:UDP:flavonoid glycosyltransferase YjiC (YdhE family)
VAAVRVLFAFVGGPGHGDPLVPIARAAVGAGHDVAFACRASLADAWSASGFEVFPLGQAGARPARSMKPLLEVDVAREERDVGERFARGQTPERTVEMEDVCRRWRADVVVCDEMEFAAVLAAERLGLPCATVVVIAAGSMLRPDVVADGLDASRAALGLPPDPTLAAGHRFLVLSPCPPSFRDPAFPLPATAHSIRPGRLVDAEIDPAPIRWPGRLDGAPTVYFTLGTEFNLESGDLFPRVLAGLASRHVNAIVTTGRDLDPSTFGPQPPHVFVTTYVPQADVLPQCDLVICHAGSGSVIGAMAHGRPMVLLPMGADQPYNAARAEALGLGLELDVVRLTPGDLAGAVERVLGDPSYRDRAAAMRAECLALPGPDHAVHLVERLAAEHGPIVDDA